MPFPTKDGRTFQQNLQDLLTQISYAFSAEPPRINGRSIYQNGEDLFAQIDAVSTHLYEQVQELDAKVLGITTDESQKPLGVTKRARSAGKTPESSGGGEGQDR